MSLLRARVDLDAIAHNVTEVKSRLGNDTQLMAVVKADAYGHGATRVAPVMARAGADAFGVATLEEALRLRRAGIDKRVLAWIWDADADLSDALSSNIELATPTPAHVQALIDAGVPAHVTVEVETGMHRAGIEEADWDDVFRQLTAAPHLEVTGLMSHLACADEVDNPHNDRQHAAFERALAAAHAAGLRCPVNHLANSAGALSRSDLRYQQVRCGLVLYGCEPIPGRTHGLRPALTWAADVVSVKPIAPGDGTCYGLTWTADKPGWLATVPVGYADGLPRSAQGHLDIGIGGKRYRQVGRVCMDQVVVDLGDNPFGVQPGDEAVVFGPGSEGSMSADELAEATGTISYEVLTWPGSADRTFRDFEGGHRDA